MLERVIKAIEIYAEGGTMDAARKACALSGTEFYQALRKNPDLQQRYYDTQQARADMMVDEAYSISGDDSKHPGVARVQAEIRLKIAGHFDRKRFGEKVDMTIDQTVSVSGALEAAKRRALRPRSDLANVPDAEVIEPAQLSAPSATDKKSEGPAIVPDPSIDPFAE